MVRERCFATRIGFPIAVYYFSIPTHVYSVDIFSQQTALLFRFILFILHALVLSFSDYFHNNILQHRFTYSNRTIRTRPTP